MIDSKIGYWLWKEAVHAIMFIQNRCMLRQNENKISYELWFSRKVIINHSKAFGSKCYINRTKNNLENFKDREDEGIFLIYSSKSKAYRFYNKIIRKKVESVNVKVD